MAFVPVTLRDLFWTDPFFASAWGDDFDLLRSDMMREHRMMWDRFGNEFGGSNRCSDCIKHECGKKEAEKKEAEQPVAQQEKTPEPPKQQQQQQHQENGPKETSVAERNEDEFWPWFMPPRRWMGPALGFGGDLASHIGQGSQLMRVKEDETKFEVSLDTHEYRPDELKVNVTDNVLTVEGKHEDKSEDGNSFVTRHFLRKYVLPKGCQAETVNSNLSSDGVLMITAPKNPYQRNHSIPIQMASQ